MINLSKQMEFYFGDPNLLRDKNLYAEMTKSKKGYIKISHFLNFSRINNFFEIASISLKNEKFNYLVRAIRRSKLLRISKNEVLVKRVVPFNPLKLTSSIT